MAVMYKRELLGAFAVLVSILAWHYRTILAVMSAIGLALVGLLALGTKASGLTDKFQGISTVVAGHRITLQHFSFAALSLSLGWRWLLGKLRMGTFDDVPAFLIIASGLRITLDIEQLEVPTTATPSPSLIDSVAVVDALLRSLHSRVALCRPFTVVLASLGVSLEGVDLEVRDGSSGALLAQAHVGELLIRAWRSSPDGGAVTAEVLARPLPRHRDQGTGLSQVKWFNHAAIACQCEGIGSIILGEGPLRINFTIPYPADLRTVPTNHPLLMPSAVELHLPAIHITLPRGMLAVIQGLDSALPPRQAGDGRMTNPHELVRLLRMVTVAASLRSFRLDVINNESNSNETNSGLSFALVNFDLACAGSSSEGFKATVALNQALLLDRSNGAEDVEITSLNNIAVRASLQPKDGNDETLEASCHMECAATRAALALQTLQNLTSLAADLAPVSPSESDGSSLATTADSSNASIGNADRNGDRVAWKCVVSVSVSLPELSVVINMDDILAEAASTRGEPLNAQASLPSSLALRVNNVAAKASGHIDDTAAPSLDAWSAEIRNVTVISRGNNIQGAEVIEGSSDEEDRDVVKLETLAAEGIEVGDSSSRMLVPSVKVASFRGCWSPHLARSFGTLAGTAARLCYDALFPPGLPNMARETEVTEVVATRAACALSPEAVQALLTLDAGLSTSDVALRCLLAESLVVVRCSDVTVDFPFQLWRSAEDDLKAIPEAVSGKGSSSGKEVEAHEDRERAVVRAQGATLAVQASGGPEPSILFQVRSTEVLCSNLSTSDSDPVAPQLAEDSPLALRRFLAVESFALEAFCDRIVELCIADALAVWTPAAQIRVLKLAQDVTYSVWDALLSYRCCKHADRSPGLILNPPLDDRDELRKCEDCFESLLASGGNKLHRLYASGIRLVASFDDSTGGEAEVRVGKLQSFDLPERWDVGSISMAIGGSPLVSLDQVSLQRTLDNDPNLCVGAALKELRTRQFAVAQAAQHSQSSGSAGDGSARSPPACGAGREGFRVALSGCMVRMDVRSALADSVADKALVAQAMVAALMKLPGRWIPDSDAFRRLFRSALTYEHLLFGEPIGPQPPPEAWVSAEGLDLSIADDPMESWLELAYPLWLDELAKRSLREEHMSRRITAIRATNSKEAAQALTSELRHQFAVHSAGRYVARALAEGLVDLGLRADGGEDTASSSSSSRGQRQQGLSGRLRGDKLRVECSAFDLHLVVPNAQDDPSDASGSSGLRRGRALLEVLDPSPPPLDTLWATWALACFEITTRQVAVTVRRFSDPIFAAKAVKFQGDALVAQTTPPPLYSRAFEVGVGANVPLQRVVQSFELPRVYLDLRGHVNKPTAAYSPAFEFGLEEIAAGCGALYPSSMTIDPKEKAHALRWWDSLRRLFTSRLDITASQLELSLLPSLRSFPVSAVSAASLDASLSTATLSSMQRMHSRIKQDKSGRSFSAAVASHMSGHDSERLLIECEHIQLTYKRLAIEVDVQGLTMDLRPRPRAQAQEVKEQAPQQGMHQQQDQQQQEAQQPLVRLPAVQVKMSYSWHCSGSAENYHFYPILTSDGLADLRQNVNTSLSLPNESNDDDDIFAGFRSEGLSLRLSAVVQQSHGPAQPHFGGSCRPLFAQPSSSFSENDGGVVSLPSSPPVAHPTVVVHATGLGQLANWAAAFKRIPPVPYPNKCRPDFKSGIWALKLHIRAIHVEKLAVNGLLDFKLLDEPKSLDSERGKQEQQPSRGLQVTVEGASASMSVSEEDEHPNPFQSGRLAADPDDPSRLWVVHDVAASVGALRGQLLGNANVDGLFLFSAQSFSFQQGAKRQGGVSLKHSLSGSLDDSKMESKAKEKKASSVASSSKEEIEGQDDKASSSTSSSSSSPPSIYGAGDSYLYVIEVNDVRGCLTVAARDALYELGEFVLYTALDAFPDLDKPRNDLLEELSKPATANESEVAIDEISSPDTGTRAATAAAAAVGGGGGSSLNAMLLGDKDCPLNKGSSTSTSDGSGPTAVPRAKAEASRMGGLFLVRVVNAQLQVVEEGKVQASALLAVGAVVIQGWIGQVVEPPALPSSSQVALHASVAAAASATLPTTSDEVSTPVSAAWSENEVLQRMVRRELPRFVEAVSVQVSGCGAFVAPTDLDATVRRGSFHWLRLAEPAPRADLPLNAFDQGIFQCVLAPFTGAEVAVVTEHGAVPISSLRLKLPLMRAEVSYENLQRLVGLASAQAVPLPIGVGLKRVRPLAANDGEVHSALSSNSALLSPLSSVTTVREAWWMKRSAQWEVMRLKRLERQLEFADCTLLDPSDLGALKGDVPSLEPWITATQQALIAANRALTAAEVALGKLVSDRKRSLQVKPHMHVTWWIGGLSIRGVALKSSNAVVMDLGAVSGQFANFLDMSGSLELDLYSLEVHFLESDKDDGESSSACATGGAAPRSSHPLLVALDATELKRIKGTLRWSGLGRELHLWSRSDPMVRVQAKLGAPDLAQGGVTLRVKHFETVVVPLAVNLTRKAVATLVEFLTPPNEAKEKKLDDKSREAFLPGAASSASLAGPLVCPSSSAHEEEARKVSSESNARAPIGGKAASADPASTEARALLLGSGVMGRPLPHPALGSGTTGGGGSDAGDGLGPAKDAPKGGMHLQYLRLGQLLLFVSYRGENWAKLEDFDSLQVKIHPVVLREQITTPGDLLIDLRNHVVVDLLSQVSRNFVNMGAFLASKFSWFSLPDGPSGGSAPQDPLSQAATAGEERNSTKISDQEDSRALLLGSTQAPAGKAPSFLGKFGVFKR